LNPSARNIARRNKKAIENIRSQFEGFKHIGKPKHAGFSHIEKIIPKKVAPGQKSKQQNNIDLKDILE